MRITTSTTLACAAALLAIAAGAPSALAAAPSTCSDSWINGSGGAWDTGTNWSAGHAPTSSDNACISAAGTYTVVVGNETITVASLSLGGSGSNPTLQIGNGGSSYPHFTVSGAITNSAGATLSD